MMAQNRVKLQVTIYDLNFFFMELGIVCHDSFNKFDTDTSPPQ